MGVSDGRGQGDLANCKCSALIPSTSPRSAWNPRRGFARMSTSIHLSGRPSARLLRAKPDIPIIVRRDQRGPLGWYQRWSNRSRQIALQSIQVSGAKAEAGPPLGQLGRILTCDFFEVCGFVSKATNLEAGQTGLCVLDAILKMPRRRRFNSR